MDVAVIYAAIWTTIKTFILLKSGREAGKSKVIAQKVVSNIVSKRQQDVLVTRANYNSIKGSVFNEILGVIEELGLTALFKVKTFPLEIYCALTDSHIYFAGIGGSDLSRSKGFKPYKGKKLSLIVIDETQQLPDQMNLDQAIASFRRHLTPDGQIIMAFNPEPQNSHWMNEYYRMREHDDNYLCIWSSYRDIADKLTKLSIEDIEKERIHNEPHWRYLYMGETDGLFGTVYHTFKRDKNLISPEELEKLIDKHKVYALVIGVDGATTRDATAFVPILILRNGQGIVVEYFYHDPQKSGSLSNELLLPYVKKWINDLEDKYDLKGDVHRYISIDPAGNADLRQTLDYWKRTFGRYGSYKVFGYTEKNIVRNAQIVQNGFSRRSLLVLDTSGYKNYINGIWVNRHVGVVQLESVIWHETGTKFEDTVPNDWTDALTYGFNFYYKNPKNMYFNAMRFKDYYEKEVKDG